MSTDATADFADWFRQSAPYIRAHRGRTFVIYVPGAAPQAAAALAAADQPLRQHEGHPVVDAAQLAQLRGVIGTLRLELEAAASASLPNTPLAGNALRLIGGNLLFARPLGVRSGVDHLHAGLPRRLDVDAVRAYLREDAVVVISPLGVSPTGENFLLDAPRPSLPASCRPTNYCCSRPTWFPDRPRSPPSSIPPARRRSPPQHRSPPRPSRRRCRHCCGRQPMPASRAYAART